MAGRAGKGVVIVVPAFTKSEKAKHEVVPTLVLGVIWPRAPEMTDRVDHERQLQTQKVPQEATL